MGLTLGALEGRGILREALPHQIICVPLKHA